MKKRPLISNEIEEVGDFLKIYSNIFYFEQFLKMAQFLFLILRLGVEFFLILRLGVDPLLLVGESPNELKGEGDLRGLL